MGILKGDNKDKISKIEQIRLDLEKKLAALEEAKYEEKTTSDAEINLNNDSFKKTEVIQRYSENNNIVDIQKNKNIDVSGKLEIEKEISKVNLDENPVFEITEPIEAAVITNISKINTEKKESVSEVIERIKNKSQSNTNIEESSDSQNNQIIFENSDFEEGVDPEKSKNNYLIYIFGIALLSLIAYYSFGYYNNSKGLEKDKMNRIISQYKNKSYLDSIELADANNQLLDLQNQKIIDSLAVSYQKELVKKNKINVIKTNARKRGVEAPNTKSTNDIKDITSTEKISDNIIKPDIVKAVDVPDAIDVFDSNIANNLSKKTVEKPFKNTLQEGKEEVVNTNTIEKTQNITKKTGDPENSKKNVIKKSPTVVKSPVYPGCEKKKTPASRKKCSTIKMYRHVQNRFNADISQDLGLKDGLYKVRVFFVIDKNGDAIVTKVRTNDKKLENEAIRVVQTLPKMIPGTEDGVKTMTSYNVPISFVVGE